MRYIVNEDNTLSFQSRVTPTTTDEYTRVGVDVINGMTPGSGTTKDVLIVAEADLRYGSEIFTALGDGVHGIHAVFMSVDQNF